MWLNDCFGVNCLGGWGRGVVGIGKWLKGCFVFLIRDIVFKCWGVFGYSVFGWKCRVVFWLFISFNNIFVLVFWIVNFRVVV